MPDPSGVPQPAAESSAPSRFVAVLADNVPELVMILGVAALGVGAWMVWPPAGLLTVGAVGVVLGFLMMRPWAS